MIKRFENFQPENWEKDFGKELSQLEDIFSNLDLDLNIKSVSSNIQYEGIKKKDIPKLIIYVIFDGHNDMSKIFEEIDKRITDSESFGYSMSHAKISFSDRISTATFDCYGFENFENWIGSQNDQMMSSIYDIDKGDIIKRLWIYFNPIK
jgi:hypothetical protein